MPRSQRAKTAAAITACLKTAGPYCPSSPSPRSSAKCELPIDHEGGHIGRTRGGRWKTWA